MPHPDNQILLVAGKAAGGRVRGERDNLPTSPPFIPLSLKGKGEYKKRGFAPLRLPI